MSDLTEKSCKPCEGGVAPLSPEEADAMLSQLDGGIAIVQCSINEPNRTFKEEFLWLHGASIKSSW